MMMTMMTRLVTFKQFCKGSAENFGYFKLEMDGIGAASRVIVS